MRLEGYSDPLLASSCPALQALGADGYRQTGLQRIRILFATGRGAREQSRCRLALRGGQEKILEEERRQLRAVAQSGLAVNR